MDNIKEIIHELEKDEDVYVSIGNLHKHETREHKKTRGQLAEFKIEVKEEGPESKAERELKAPQKSIRRHGSMHCKVSLLDDTVYECVVEVSAFCFPVVRTRTDCFM